ncbi:MAG: PAS domain S-box protein, partial [Deltaproteobacteria bacterium]
VRIALADVSERKRQEERIRRGEHLYRSMFETMPVGVVHQDAQGRITSANPAAERILGLSFDQMQGRTSVDQGWKAIHEDGSDFPGSEHPAMVALRTGTEVRGKLMGVFHPVKESYTWISVSAVPQIDSSTQAVESVFTTFEDVTERHRSAVELRESERWLRQSQAIAHIGRYVLDIPTNRLTTSPEMDAIFGIDASFVREFGNWRTLVHPDDQDGMEKRLRGAVERGVHFDLEYRIVQPSTGQVRRVNAVGEVERAPDGAPLRLVGIVQDITERSRAESETAAVTAMLHRTGELAKVGGWELDLATQTLRFSAEARFINEVEPGEIIALEEALGRIDPEHRPGFQAALRAAIDDGLPFDLEIPMVTARGRRIWARTQGTVVREEGRVVKLVGAFQDVSDRRAAEESLRESEERFRAQFEGHAAVQLVIDPDTGAIIDANPAAAAFYGWPRERLRQMQIEQINALTPAEIAEELRRASTRERTIFQFRHRRADGSIRDVEVFSSKIQAGRRALLHSIVQDVTERKHAEEKVRNSEALLRGVTESSPDSIFAKDRDGRWTFANAAALRVVGRPSQGVLGKTDDEIMRDPVLVQRLTANDRTVLESGVAQTFEEDILAPSGMRTFLSTKAPLRDAEGQVTGVVGVAKDVTEQRSLQRQLAQAGRLAAIGTLVSGVSHEINNPLSGVLAGGGIAMESSQEALRLVTEGAVEDRDELVRLLHETAESLQDVQHGAHRIAQIVKDLSLFARPNPQRSRVRLIDVVDQAMRWLPASVGGTVTLRVEDGGAPDVQASSGQIGQVLVNLVTNAAKATPPGRKGEVVVRIGSGEPGMARIDVIDSGVGMAPDVVDRIFDPFFTTRPAGEGTGLGLPIVHAIVTAHGGTITVESQVGKGSTFRVELPVAPAEA